MIADIPMQKTACRQYCAERGWTVAGEFQEAGVSGYKNSAFKRVAVKEIIAAAHQHLFNILLVYTIDRLSRRDSELPMLLEEMTACGIAVWSVEDGEIRYKTSTDRLMAYLYGWKANGESERISQRISTIQRQMVARGEYRGGTVPYGYCLIETGKQNKQGKKQRVLSVYEPEAAVIRMIFKRIATEGCSMYQLTKELASMPVPEGAREMAWRSATLHVIIRNQIYIGRQRFNNELSLPYTQLQIIDPLVFQQVQQLTQRKRENNKSSKLQKTPPPEYHDIVFCGHCGSHLVYNHAVQPRQHGQHTIRYLYRCYNKERFVTPCDGACTYSARIVDQNAHEHTDTLVSLFLSISRETFINNALEFSRVQLLSTRDTIKQKITALDAQLADVQQGIAEGLRLFGVSATSSLQLLFEDMRAQRCGLEHQLKKSTEIMQTASSIARQKQNELNEVVLLCKAWKSASHDERNALIPRFFSRIHVHKEYRILYEIRPELQQFIVIDDENSLGYLPKSTGS